MAWRLAKSLEKLRSQINERYPGRSKISDGTIGDTAHAARVSDHNPNSAGVVTAIDITHDPAHGVDTWKMAETLRQNRDERIKYVISNGRIFAGNEGPSPWIWRNYTGSNKHAIHIHISVLGNSTLYDFANPWTLAAPVAVMRAPTPPKPAGITDDMRLRMVKLMLEYEYGGTLAGGVIRVHVVDGQPEIGGITQKSHPEVYARLKMILDRGDQATLKSEIYKFYLGYTAPAQNWTDRAGIEFILRDCIVHRGQTGGAEILQMALGFTGADLDREVGPTTRGKLASLEPSLAIDRITATRETYEDKHFDNGNGKNWRIARGQWDGLVNRWSKARAAAKQFQAEQRYTPLKSPEGAAATGIIAVGGGTAIAIKQDPWTGTEVAMAAFSIGVAAFIAFMVVRKLRRKT